MLCPRCGKSTPERLGRCASCGAEFARTSIGTGVIPIDTTGLPPGATFGASTGVATIGGPPAATIDGALTVAVTTGAEQAVPEVGPLKVGQAFGPRYHIIKLLGAGGMGAVYQAWDAELSVAVALKVIRTDPRRRSASSDAEKRFKQELLLARQVTHKHVVRIHDLGEINGIKYITMPYIQGHDLATVLRGDGRLPIARTLHLARQIADGLAAAHEAGVVHRDLKPANIMITGAGDDEQALIMDFGISASADQATVGTVLGTLEYMAPEQATGGAVDGRADIYAYGLIVYEMLTGPRLVASATPQARIDAMKQRFAEGMVPVRMLDASIPPPLEAVVMRCLELEPASRFQTTADLVAALSALDANGELIPEPRRLTRRLMIAAAAIVVLLLGGMYAVGRRMAPVVPVQHEPVPVLIADFDNRSGEQVFEGSVEQTLALALERAPYITVFKTKDARSIATQLAPGKGDRITPEMGQLIARREGLKVLLSGAIDKQGAGYRLELRALDPANGKALTTASLNVKDKAQVLDSITTMATRVREALGESRTEMAKLAAAETVTAGSLDAMRAYAHAQELSLSSKFQEALQEYQRAAALDPRFGRAYAGMAGVYINYFKQPDKAEASYQAALKNLDRMTEREKYRTLGTYYLDIARNYEKAIENFETLVKLYPADDGGHGNLALAYLLIGNNVPRAVSEVRKSLEIYPKNSLQRYNYAMYSMYAGDFATAAAEASRLQQENPSFEYNYLPLALSRLAQGDVEGSRGVYAQLARVSPLGSSFANQGQADLEMYFARYRAAVSLLHDGISADRQRKNSAGIAQKSVALAETYLALGERNRAVEAANQAITLSRHESTLFPAARVLLQSRQEDKAAQVAQDLEKMLQRHTTAYARLISGEIAAQRGRVGDAIDAFRDAQKRHDSWFGRFVLGKAYAEAGHYAEALTELEACIKRRGETADVFFYDTPTLRYLPPAYYWLGRSQEGVGATAEARKSYEQFLALRADANPPDPLAADARQRVSLH